MLGWIESLWSSRQEELTKTAVVLVVAALAWWIFVRVGRRITGRLSRGEGVEAAEQRQRVVTLWRAVRRVAAILVFISVLLTLASVWGIPIAPLLAVGSAAAVAVGFGAQSVVKDVIAGFLILAEDQYAVGDVVRVSDVAGRVEDIRLRVTVLRDLEGNVHYVPNGLIAVASNLTQEYAQVVIDVGIAYREQVDRGLATFGDELARMAAEPEWQERILEEPKVLGVDQLADSSVVLRGTLQVVPDDRWMAKREALRRVKNRFDADGIEIPFPHLTLYLGDEAVVRGLAAGEDAEA